MMMYGETFYGRHTEQHQCRFEFVLTNQSNSPLLMSVWLDGILYLLKTPLSNILINNTGFTYTYQCTAFKYTY